MPSRRPTRIIKGVNMKSLTLLATLSLLLAAKAASGCMLPASAGNTDGQGLVLEGPKIEVFGKSINFDTQASPISAMNSGISLAVFNIDIAYPDGQQESRKLWLPKKDNEMNPEHRTEIVTDQLNANRRVRF